jgi:hypothetical protein
MSLDANDLKQIIDTVKRDLIENLSVELEYGYNHRRSECSRKVLRCTLKLNNQEFASDYVTLPLDDD